MDLALARDDDAFHGLTRRIEHRPQADGSVDPATGRPARQQPGSLFLAQEARTDRRAATAVRRQRYPRPLDHDLVAGRRSRLVVGLNFELARRAGHERLRARRSRVQHQPHGGDREPPPPERHAMGRRNAQEHLDHFGCPFGQFLLLAPPLGPGLARDRQPRLLVTRAEMAGTSPPPHRARPRVRPEACEHGPCPVPCSRSVANRATSGPAGVHSRETLQGSYADLPDGQITWVRRSSGLAHPLPWRPHQRDPARPGRPGRLPAPLRRGREPTAGLSGPTAVRFGHGRA